MKMNKMSSIALVVSKILEVGHWIGCVGMAILLVASIASPDWVRNTLANGEVDYGRELTTYGITIAATDTAGESEISSVILFSITAIIVLALMAMVFRNIYLIFKTAKGQTKFAQGETPFQKDIARMVKEIGIFYIAVPIVGLIMTTIARFVISAPYMEFSVSMDGIITGIIILCLSQVFVYGMQLEKDVDGLL